MYRMWIIICIRKTDSYGLYNPQIQKSGETKTKGSKSDKNWAESQFQAVIEI